MKNNVMLIAGIAFSLVTGCKKEEPNRPVSSGMSTLGFNVRYHVDGKTLEFDTLLYRNAAGNEYSVSKLHYFISRISFRKAGGEIYTDHTVHYLDAKDAATNAFEIRNVPAGYYSGLSLLIGLDSIYNKTGSLPATLEHINMAWPDVMGGGYHFLKLEGYFKDTLTSTGFAIHLGTNECLVKVDIDRPVSFLPGYRTLHLNMNVNEWFDHPFVYDLSTGNYTMGIKNKMLEISQNGTNVFTLD